jgi:hypothetical protein
MRYVIGILMCVIFQSCTKLEDFKTKDPISQNEVYTIKESINSEKLKLIYLDIPQIPKNIGESILNGTYLYILEKNKGIHVFDNSDPLNPTNILFIHVPAINDFVINDNLLLCNNAYDLISCKIGLIEELKKGTIKLSDKPILNDYFTITNRKANAFNFINYPEVRNIYFECPDSAGIVIEWEKKLLDKTPNCYR